MSDCGITNFGGKVSISTTAVSSQPDEVAAGSLAYEELPNVGNHGDTGITQNLPTYSTWGRTVVCKQKGEATAQDFDIEAQDVPSAGLDLFIAAAAPTNSNSYVIKTEWSDGSVEYNWGPITGPTLLKGGNEDFKRVQFTVGANMVPLRVEATSST